MGTNMCCLKITNKNKSTSVTSVNNANNELIHSFLKACMHVFRCELEDLKTRKITYQCIGYNRDAAPYVQAVN